MDNIEQNHKALDSSISSSGTEVFFNHHLQLFKEVVQSTGDLYDYYYKMGPFIVLLRFANSALISTMTPALEHLQVSAVEKADLTVFLYDNISTDTESLPFPWSTDDYISSEEIQWFDHEPIRTAYYLSTGILNILNFQTDQAVFWIKNFADIPYHESGSPLRAILYWWMKKQGYQFAHASAVGTKEGGVLLIGKGGSGKSTSALACLNEEKLVYAGDDYVLIKNDETPYVYSIYNSAKLDASHIKNFPELLQFISNKEYLKEEKALIFLHQHFQNKISLGFPIRAILMPYVSGKKETTYYKSTSSNALRALAPSTIFQIPGAGADTFQYLGDFVKRVPCYRLESGTEISKLPNTIISILSKSLK